MHAELSLLAWSVVFLFVQMPVAALGANRQLGRSTLGVGSRTDTDLPATPLVWRAPTVPGFRPS